MELTKGANAGLDGADRVVVRLAWTTEVEVDMSAILLDGSGKIRSDDDFIFYNQPRHPSGSVAHLGPSAGAGRDDAVGIRLGDVPSDVTRVVLAASAGGRKLGDVGALRLDVLDASTQSVLLTFVVQATVETAILGGEVYRRNGSWKFRAVGQGYASGLKGVATDFGLTVEDDELVAEQQSPTPVPPPPVPSPPSVQQPPSQASGWAPPLAVPAVVASVPVERAAPPVAATPVDDEEVTLQAFQTQNPFLTRLFTMKEYGRAPGKAIQVFRERVLDPEEKMLAAFRSQHGPLKWGYVIMTTHWVRWFQTLPLKDEEMFEYNDRLDMTGSVLVTSTGQQFQLKGFGAGRKYKALYRVAQQAHLWEQSH